MKSKKRENYQDFHERMEKKRMRVKRVRKWRAWAFVGRFRCKGQLLEVCLEKPKAHVFWTPIEVEIREVRR